MKKYIVTGGIGRGKEKPKKVTAVTFMVEIALQRFQLCDVMI